MKVLIVSDTHGRNHYLIDTVNRVAPIDCLFILGILRTAKSISDLC
jgi:predicted phosphodiesterase